MAHEMFLSNDTRLRSINGSNASMMLASNSLSCLSRSGLTFTLTRSLALSNDTYFCRKCDESAAMLPSAQTHCSASSSSGEFKRLINNGTAPLSTTASVCSELPLQMLVNTHAASN
mgnify:CR=1 FL=1